jgi:4'-phosphopantetheinyl transferase
VTPARPEAVALADQHFAPSERSELATLQDCERAGRFVDYWVLKESYTKALGAGLSRRLSSFSFDLGADAVRVEDAQRDPAERRDWQFDLLRIGQRHACGVAVRRDGAAHPLQVRSIDFAATLGRRHATPPPLLVVRRPGAPPQARGGRA